MRALISVSNKEGIKDFAKRLSDLGIEIISTGGTARSISDAGIPVIGISDVTGFPECLDGRVKTLHPKIHGGLLAIRDNEDHMKQMRDLDIKPIDLVVVNLYPFKETILKDDVTREEAIENIDIGGPTMLRSAAKNYKDVAVVVDPNDYMLIAEQLETKGFVSQETKFYLASKVFEHTASYDALIADYFRTERKDVKLPQNLTLTFEKVQEMRYGENPHQKAAFYSEIKNVKGYLNSAIQLHGKELSFNNINDTNGALELLKEFDEPTIVACKHANPCGVGSDDRILEAYKKAYQSDPVSIYGGIVVSNREIEETTAEEINKIFIEIIAAPSYSEKALEILKGKKNIRLLQVASIDQKQPITAVDLKKVGGGVLVQTIDFDLFSEDGFKTVTKRKPTDREIKDLIFAWKVVKHTKSNGISIAKDRQTIGIGPGQVSRIWACKQAIEHGMEYFGSDVVNDSVLASDAFFPFSDSVEEAIKAGITAIIQPGGSVRDEEVINACDDAGIAMLFTGMRHFKH
ncbi:MAG: Bifunctional purine biosynthesis protein purH [Clostridiales bacterium 38_11]|nr:MAG: Bifunctional purine biosynthesis protein purH [Clostridiales bacterium 38_11]HBH12772.1 bifunctional phosphoribosylaminoimidazolecarboxamide formyltransferase/inosine monophosphate cyclohydrolase [Clostridiales bacterium]